MGIEPEKLSIILMDALPPTPLDPFWSVLFQGLIREGPLFFLGGGVGMTNIEKNCLQGLKRQNKLFANIICIKKIVCIEVREFFFNFLIF